MQDVNNQLFSDSVWNECMLSLGGREEGEAKERAEATLASLDLLGARGVHPMALSGGQKQRLAVACALLSFGRANERARPRPHETGSKAGSRPVG